MKPLRSYRIDAFTNEPGRGNPVGVVTNAGGLDEARLQAIARDIGFGRSVFVFPALAGDHDLRLRFFTPLTEVPACADAAVAAHTALALEGAASGLRRQFTRGGVQRVQVHRHGGGQVVCIELGRPVFRPPLAPRLVRELAAALGIAGADLDFRCPLQQVDSGLCHVLVGVEKRSCLTTLEPDLARLARLSPVVGGHGCLVFTLETEDDDDACCHARMFAPSIGIDEEAVSGDANGALGAYLARYGLLAANLGRTGFRARQQAASGRGGFLDVEVDIVHGVPATVTITGHAVPGSHVSPLVPHRA